jgi:hypothetical protein
VPARAKYRSTLARPTADLKDGDIDLLYMRGIRLQAAYEDLQKRIERDEAPEPDRHLLAPLQVLLAGHGPLVQSTRRGLELYEQADRDRRTRAEELALKAAHLALEAPLSTEARATTTEEAASERRESTEMIGEGRHPERASTAGRNVVRNYYIALAELARRWVAIARREPGKAAQWTTRQVASSVFGAAVAGSAFGQAASAAGSAALDYALATGGLFAAVAADFMVRHASELKDLARAGGASFDWLITFVDWLVGSVRRIDEAAERAQKERGDAR